MNLVTQTTSRICNQSVCASDMSDAIRLLSSFFGFETGDNFKRTEKLNF